MAVEHFVPHSLSPMVHEDLGTVGERASVVIFGASGDLTARKLIPALFQLWKEGYLSSDSPVIGVARREKNHESFRREVAEGAASQARGEFNPEEWSRFEKQIFYIQHDISAPSTYPELSKKLLEIEEPRNLGGRLVYLATTPDLFVPAAVSMAQAGMIAAPGDAKWCRIVFEKPFGTDLVSSQLLSRTLNEILSEDQIYRIDHYLGKETVQNILLFRFGNSIFEPLLNRNHVDHVQITVAESQGMERGRGGYYDQAGALRDVLQNHVLQLLCLVAMEPPAMFRAKEIRDEKLKVLQALAPGNQYDLGQWAVAGQYLSSVIDGKNVPGYLEEDRIPHDSRRETFAALDVRIDNWRWAGVPFFLRTGKRMPHRVSEIAIQFKLPPLHLFTTVECEGDICDLVGARPNTLVFRIQPSESISFVVSTKRPGMQYQIHPVQMDFSYEDQFKTHLPEAYERLLLDVLRGDSTLFTRSDELEAAWRFCTPILESWESSDRKPETYPAGSWGPAAADELLHRIGARWRKPKPV